MIVYDIACERGHVFEGWFADKAAFDAQRDAGQIPCTHCASIKVERTLSVPRIGAKSNSDTPSRADVARRLATLQTEMLRDSTWVGDTFAARARSMADGEEPHATIHGQATLGDAKALHDDGIKVLPLAFPVIPPEQRN